MENMPMRQQTNQILKSTNNPVEQTTHSNQLSIHKQDGFTLIELMFAGSIAIILIGAVFAFMLNAQKESTAIKDKGSRVFDFLTLKKQLAQPLSLRGSKDFGDNINMLRPCLMGGATPTCTQDCCKTGQANDFMFLDPNDNNPDLTKRRKLTGTPAAPVRYRADGQICDAQTPANQCVFQVSTTFKAQCTSDDATVTECDHAYLITINLDIKGAATAGPTVRSEKVSLTHFVAKNYPPTISKTDPDVTPGLTLNKSESKKIKVTVDAGSPTETQQGMFFDTCTSSNPAVATVKCYAILGGVGTIMLEAKNAGTTSISVNINDGQFENLTSALKQFTVTVQP
jgi:hypothetical protein